MSIMVFLGIILPLHLGEEKPRESSHNCPQSSLPTHEPFREGVFPAAFPTPSLPVFRPEKENRFLHYSRFLFCVPNFLLIFFPPRILGSCTSLMQAIQVLIMASKDLQREIVESGRVSMGEDPWTGGANIIHRLLVHQEATSTRYTHPHSVKSTGAALSCRVRL